VHELWVLRDLRVDYVIFRLANQASSSRLAQKLDHQLATVQNREL
jgi:hypothetical protein